MVIKQKYLQASKLYNLWSKKYDKENNLLMFLEEQMTSKLFNFSGKNILDLGCGTGRYAVPLAMKNNVVAVDFSEGMLKKARENAKKSRIKIEFVLSDVVKFKSRKKFDVILSMLVQDHVEDLDKSAKAIFDVSMPGTELFVSNVNPEFLSKIDDKSRIPIFMNFYTDEYFHPLKEYVKVFRKYGFKLLGKKNIVFRKKYLDFIELDNPKSVLNKTLGVLYHFRRTG